RERAELESRHEIHRGGELGRDREATELQRPQRDGDDQAGEKRRRAGLHRGVREELVHQPRPTRMTPFSSRTSANARFSCARLATSKVKRMKASSSRFCVRAAVTLIFSRASASPMSRSRPRRSVAVTIISTE